MSQLQPQSQTSLARNILSSVFGYDAFRGMQEEIVETVMAGQSCCVLMPTGSGKSLCYQIPAIGRQGTGLVISPLIALMQDQISALKECGARAETLNSSLSGAEYYRVMDLLKSGSLDLLYIAPERAMSEDFLELMDQIDLSLIAIDEAHCISQWGHDFRPDYMALSTLRARYADVPCIAVTATADEPTRKDILDKLSIDKLFTGSVDRPNITYHVEVKDNPKYQLKRFIKSRGAGESGIVYCLSRRKVEDIAQYLCDEGYNALPYHAGLPKEMRASNQDRFLKEENVIMVATVAFGMGINKPDVRFVFHMDLPKNIEAYYQETGRAGRDGLPSVAYMIYGLQDVAQQYQMLDSSDAPDNQKRIERQKLEALLGYCEAGECRRQVLLRYFGDEGPECGNCDTCLNPPKMMDGTISAQKLLSCIARTGQLFGGAYVIDVLLGKENERIKKFRHDQLSTWGIGKEHSKQEWSGIIRQLTARNFIHVDIANHGGLKITPEGKKLMSGKLKVELREDRKIKLSKSSSSTRQQKPAVSIENEADQNLFDRLKVLRQGLAKSQKVAPYMVFHDKALLEMATTRPETLDQMAEISGVGEAKLEKYGEIFLETLGEAA